MTTTAENHTDTAENHTDTAGAEEDTVVVPRPQFPQPPHGYAPYGGPGYGQPHAGPYGQQPYGPLSAGFAAGFPAPAPNRGLAAVSRTTWIAVTAALTLIVAMVAVVVIATGSKGDTAHTSRRYADPSATTEAAPADPGKVLGSAALTPLLLNPTEIGAIVGKPTAGARVSTLFNLPAKDTLVSGQECLPLAFTAESEVYQGSGFTGMRLQYTKAKEGAPVDRDWVFHQAAFAYPTVKAAEDFLVSNAAKWKLCENKSWGRAEATSDGGTRDYYWSAGTVDISDAGLVTAPITQENGEGWACWRGMSLVANVVNDFTVCGLNTASEQINAAADAIAKKIPTI